MEIFAFSLISVDGNIFDLYSYIDLSIYEKFFGKEEVPKQFSALAQILSNIIISNIYKDKGISSQDCQL